ncbi:unnamed protein product [Ceutorhynchus assimilis]|uniref:CHK kinase-like domain-containing protein n=1 Tax=Ceutorhynchus assimilis TaxID=467358 RepID=A0A9N9QMZ4_9CUCU|nr:unnamed protein product [Ceutorhynchus assimilis]
MDSLSSDLQKLIKHVAICQGIENFILHKKGSASNDGDGYVGILEAWQLKDKNSDRKLEFVLKRAPKSEALRKQFPTRQAFLKEIYVYTKIFPEIIKFQREHNIPHPFDSVAMFYGAIENEPEETLILRNLKEDGYSMHDRLQPLNSLHLSLVIASYARLHAISHAMKILDPERYERLTENHRNNIMTEFIQTKHQESSKGGDSLVEGMEKTRKMFFDPVFEAIKDNPNLAEVVKQKMMKSFESFYKDESDNDEFTVIGHGDCWNANILFSYEDKSNPGVPTNVKLIDWQLSRVVQPIYDLSYFFYISAGKEDLWQYQKYLKEYHTVLSEALRNFGLDTKLFYPYDLLEKEWKKYSRSGVILTCLMLPQSLSKSKTHDLQKMAENNENLFDPSLKRFPVTKMLTQRITDLMKFLIDSELL